MVSLLDCRLCTGGWGCGWRVGLDVAWFDWSSCDLLFKFLETQALVVWQRLQLTEVDCRHRCVTSQHILLESHLFLTRVHLSMWFCRKCRLTKSIEHAAVHCCKSCQTDHVRRRRTRNAHREASPKLDNWEAHRYRPSCSLLWVPAFVAYGPIFGEQFWTIMNYNR